MRLVKSVCEYCQLWLFGALVAMCVMTALPGAAQDKSERAYVFGNSLIHHLTDSDETTVPHWVALMAKEAGHEFRLSGQWGFVRDFVRTLPPQPNWSFRNVQPSWDSERRSFARADLTNVWLNPANFIQMNSVSTPYEGDNPDRASPLSATQSLLEWVSDQSPQTDVYIYEGWPEMGAITRSFPPSPDALAQYHSFATGPYADWFDSYVSALDAALPQTDVALIPASRILSSVMTETALSALPADTFYSDDAPHGTSATYLMAAMVVYNTIYAEPVPESFRPPSSVAPELRATFSIVRDAIWNRVQQLDDVAALAPAAAPQSATAPQPQVPAAQVPQPAQTPTGLQLDNPSLAMGLNGIADWSVQHPFLDIMKTARPWIGHGLDQWGAFPPEDIAAGGYLNAQGWPTRLPDGARALEAFLLTDQPQDAVSLTGRYVVTYEGSGDLNVTGRAKNIQRSEGEISFDFSPGEGLVALVLTRTDASDPIRSIRVFREEHRALLEAGATFNPAWIAKIENLRSLRFMDWMGTNGSPSTSWDTRPLKSDYTYLKRGVPAEVMIELSNLIGADPWFNMPHMADDEYFRKFAQLVKEQLRPELKAYVEYSNEVWNFVFPQAKFAADAAKERWGRKAGDDAWMQFYGMRSAQMAQIWTDVFGSAASDRLVPVIGTHSGWLGLEESILNAPLWADESPDNWPPYVFFEAYAVTGYFGHEMGTQDGAPQVLGWLEDSLAAARQTGKTKGLSGADLDAYVIEHRYDAAFQLLDTALREGSFTELLEVIFPAQAKVAFDHGLDLVMYEGGTHVAVGGEFSQNEALIEFFKAFNYSDQMAGLYRDLLGGWKEAGGTLFNAFVDVSKPSQYGSWGALRHLDDSNPRWDALMQFNVSQPGWWDGREQSAFLGGRIAQGSAQADELVGTLFADVLSGGAGDDVLLPTGGKDILHGGAGIDAALLPGAPSDYSFSRNAGVLVVKSKRLEAELHEVEMLWFESDEDLAILVDDLI